MNRMKELAKSLDGREYLEEMKGIDIEELKREGIVVVFGYSDDLMEFRGAINDEVGSGIAYIDEKGLMVNFCDSDDCPYYQEIVEKSLSIEALWCKEEPYCWTFKTSIHHYKFDIMEDGEKFCRGIIFSLKNINSGT